jgi:DNA-binding NarL/FixJ family response regulator
VKKIRILIADDHPVVRAGLASMLEAESDLEVIAVARDGREAVHMALEHLPDVILMDLRMPVMSGRDAIRELASEKLGGRVLVLSTYGAHADVAVALSAGAAGFLLKDAGGAELVAAVRQIARGERVLAPAVVEELGLRNRAAAVALSPRELEVLELLTRGLSNRAIANALYVSEATIKTHLIHVFEKLGVSDRTAAVTEALKLGLVHLDTSG